MEFFRQTCPAMIRLRWLIAVDFPAVLAIENATTGIPWSEADFRAFLQRSHSVCFVAEVANAVMGFVAWETVGERIELLKLAVNPNWRRRGVGTVLIEKLTQRINSGRQQSIIADVDDSNLDSQLFFRSQGFVAVRIQEFVPGWEQIEFVYEKMPPVPEFYSRNRVLEQFRTE